MKNEATYQGGSYQITLVDGQFALDDYVGPQRDYDSFEEMVSAHPICSEAREFFFGVTIRNVNERFGDPVEYTGETLAEAIEAFQTDVKSLGYGSTVNNDDWELVDN